jgi:hypothetical protein
MVLALAAPLGLAPVTLGVGGVVAVGAPLVVSASASAQVDDSNLVFGPRKAVDRLPCQANDRPETDLQGRMRPDGATEGYICNVEVVGQVTGQAWANHDQFEDCAYYGKSSAFTYGGVQVVDISDPQQPTTTTVLTTPGMLDPGESLRTNVKRKLLAATGYDQFGSPTAYFLDIYDISDCRNPRLLSSTNLAPAAGHSGWFSPDGMTWYMSGNSGTFPVDISDPAKPRVLASWPLGSNHDGMTTEDGARTYICRFGEPSDAVLILDTSNVAARSADPKSNVLKEVSTLDNGSCQGAIRVTQKGHPYLIQYGETAPSSDCSRSADNWATWSYPKIYDLADERKPVMISTMITEVLLPEHCEEVTGEGALAGILGYGVHHCSPDRLYDPTILACAYTYGGFRVFDIRDVYQPVEIGYYNPGGHGACCGVNARPVPRYEQGMIWFTHDQGFYGVRLTNGTWPFKEANPCPEFDDYYFAQYNPTSRCPTSNLNGIGKPAPGGVGAPAPTGGRPSAKPKPKLSLRVSPRRDRRAPFKFRVSGRLIRPAGVGADGCQGFVNVSVRGRGRSQLVRNISLTRTCRFRVTVKLKSARKFGRRLRIQARFAGNAKLRPAASRRVAARVR